MSLPRLNLFLGIFLSAGTCLALDIRTRSGVTYKHVKILEVQPDRLRIMHSFGVTSIDFEDLPNSFQKRYHYNPENAILPRAQHAAEEKRAAEQRALIEQAQATNTTVASTAKILLLLQRQRHNLFKLSLLRNRNGGSA